MTRATVGGINSEDNLWYPLAVNSQGIAQIDTSVIPQPMEWEYGTFTPEYASAEGSGSALIEYQRQAGWYAKLGDMVWINVRLNTSSVVITDARGYLIVTGFPFTWDHAQTVPGIAGTCLSYAADFNNDIVIYNARPFRTNLAIYFQHISDIGPSTTGFINLREHNGGIANEVRFSHWGKITSTKTPSFVIPGNGILQETDEIPTGTP